MKGQILTITSTWLTYWLIYLYICIHPKTMNFALENSRVEDERPKRCTRSDVESVGRLDSEIPPWKNPQVWKASGMRRSAAWQVGPHPPGLNASPDSQIWVCLDQVLNRGVCSSLEIPNYQETKKNRIAADSTGICWRWQVGLSFNKNWWNHITVLLVINGKVLEKIRGW